MMTRFAKPILDGDTWRVWVTEGRWQGFMTEMNDLHSDEPHGYHTMAFATEEDAKAEADRYNEFWRD